MPFTALTIRFVSDGCFAGSSLGPVGDVDLCQEVDDLGLPAIGGRVLRGLLVEEGAVFLRALGNSRGWCDAAEETFGRPGGQSGALRVGTARVPLQDRQPLADQGVPTPAAVLLATRAHTVVRRQTRIEPDTGAAARGSLRGVRLAPRGTVLEAPLTWHGGSVEGAPAECRALLWAAAVLLRRGGIHRTRGWGRLQCSLARDGQEMPEWGEPARRALGGGPADG